MRVLLLALPGIDHSTLRPALGAALGASAVDACHAVEAAITWLENRPCDLIAVAGPASGLPEALVRLRRASRGLPLLALLPETTSPEAGAAWLAGADDVLPMSSLTGTTPPEGLDEVRTAERDAARRIQRLWYAGSADALRQQLLTRLSGRFREVGLSGEGLSGLTTQDFEAPQTAALVVNALGQPDAMVLGVRRVKRTHPALAITVVADVAHHEAFRRAGADECLTASSDADPVLVAVGRAQARCRIGVELDALRARETRLRALVEQLPEAVVLVSPEHAVLAVNVAGLRLIGAHDARQVLGAPLAPWVASETDDGLTTLVDSVVGGATRDAVVTTSQLAHPRRLLIRAVPFQRENGGRPAALMVLRDLANEPVTHGQPEIDLLHGPANRQGWEEERATLIDRLRALEADLVAATALTDRIPVLEDALHVALTREQALAPALQTAARLEGFGIEVDRIPELLEAAQRLHAFERDELPLLQELRDRIGSLEAELSDTRRAAKISAATAEAAQSTLDVTQAALGAALDRVADLESRLASTAPPEETAATTARIADLEDQLTEAAVQRMALQADGVRAQELELRLENLVRANLALEADVERLSAPVEAPTPAAGSLSPEQAWMLEDVAALGVVQTSRDGRVISANAHAARACGFARGDDLVRAGELPAPLRALAGDDPDEASRFEVCLQNEHDGAPRWVAGVRLPQRDDQPIAWWLVDVSTRQPIAAREQGRVQAMASVLEVATAECATLIATPAARPLGPHAVETGGVDRPSDAEAVARTQVMLGQLTALGRRRGTARAEDLRFRLATLAPLLERLAGDDVLWALTLPETAVHACVTGVDFDRCVIALVASGRDALPLGGRLTLRLREDVPDPTSSGIRRPESLIAVTVQGFGRTDVQVPGAVIDLTTSMGGRIEVTAPDDMGAEMALRIPRAFLLTQAA